MTPYENGGIYGFSDHLAIESYIKAGSTNYELTQYGPQTVGKTDAYSFGFSIGTNTSISYSRQKSTSNLEVYNNSKTPDGIVGSNYDYLVRGWGSKDYYRQETHQYAYYVIRGDNALNIKNQTIFYARFAYHTSDGYFSIVDNALNYFAKWNYHNFNGSL